MQFAARDVPEIDRAGAGAGGQGPPVRSEADPPDPALAGYESGHLLRDGRGYMEEDQSDGQKEARHADVLHGRGLALCLALAGEVFDTRTSLRQLGLLDEEGREAVARRED